MPRLTMALSSTSRTRIIARCSRARSGRGGYRMVRRRRGPGSACPAARGTISVGTQTESTQPSPGEDSRLEVAAGQHRARACRRRRSGGPAAARRALGESKPTPSSPRSARPRRPGAAAARRRASHGRGAHVRERLARGSTRARAPSAGCSSPTSSIASSSSTPVSLPTARASCAGADQRQRLAGVRPQPDDDLARLAGRLARVLRQLARLAGGALGIALDPARERQRREPDARHRLRERSCMSRASRARSASAAAGPAPRPAPDSASAWRSSSRRAAAPAIATSEVQRGQADVGLEHVGIGRPRHARATSSRRRRAAARTRRAAPARRAAPRAARCPA